MQDCISSGIIIFVITSSYLFTLEWSHVSYIISFTKLGSSCILSHSDNHHHQVLVSLLLSFHIHEYMLVESIYFLGKPVNFKHSSTFIYNMCMLCITKMERKRKSNLLNPNNNNSNNNRPMVMDHPLLERSR